MKSSASELYFCPLVLIISGPSKTDPLRDVDLAFKDVSVVVMKDESIVLIDYESSST